MAFEEVRPYTPGDEVRFIDWNVTARAGDPHVKVFQEERELRLLILLDNSASQSFTGDAHAKIRTGAHAAVALAAAATRGGDRAGLLTFDEKVRTRIPLRSGASLSSSRAESSVLVVCARDQAQGPSCRRRTRCVYISFAF